MGFCWTYPGFVHRTITLLPRGSHSHHRFESDLDIYHQSEGFRLWIFHIQSNEWLCDSVISMLSLNHHVHGQSPNPFLRSTFPVIWFPSWRRRSTSSWVSGRQITFDLLCMCVKPRGFRWISRASVAVWTRHSSEVKTSRNVCTKLYCWTV